MGRDNKREREMGRDNMLRTAANKAITCTVFSFLGLDGRLVTCKMRPAAGNSEAEAAAGAGLRPSAA